MRALVVSLESFQKGEVPKEVIDYIASCTEEPFIILDESSKIKTNTPCKDSKKSKRTQAILKLQDVGHRCILTGTFMSKSPCNAYDQMNFLKKGFFKESMFAFAERYEIRRNLPTVRGARVTITQKDYDTIRRRLLRCGNDKDKLNSCLDGIKSYFGFDKETCRHIYAHEDYTPYRNLDELWNRIGGTCYRIDRSVQTGLPPKVYSVLNCTLTEKQKKLYKQLQKQFCTDNITVDNGLELYLRFQDVCNGYEPVEDDEGKVSLIPLKENPKLELLLEVIESIGDKQVVVWCSRTALLYDAEKLIKEKGYTTAIYDGKIDKTQRKNGYVKFTEKEVQIIFVNQASGAYGLDGFKEADYAVYLCNSYSVEQRTQSEDRIYRGNVTRSKYIIDITCKGTVEDRVTESLKLGKELINSKGTDSKVFMLDERKVN